MYNSNPQLRIRIRSYGSGSPFIDPDPYFLIRIRSYGSECAATDPDPQIPKHISKHCCGSAATDPDPQLRIQIRSYGSRLAATDPAATDPDLLSLAAKIATEDLRSCCPVVVFLCKVLPICSILAFELLPSCSSARKIPS